MAAKQDTPAPAEHYVNVYIVQCMKRAQKVLSGVGVSNPDPETVARVADMLRQQDNRECVLRIAITTLEKINNVLDAWLGKPKAGT